MLRITFNQEMHEVKDDILLLGSMVEDAVMKSVEALREVYDMAEKAVDMLHRAMTTFANEDMQTAKNIILEDDAIDECYTQLYYQAVNNVLGDPRNIERVNYVIGVAHNLERLGDRVTNICERVVYIVTGERPELTLVPQEFRLSPNEN